MLQNVSLDTWVSVLGFLRWCSFHIITAVLGVAILRGWVHPRWGVGMFTIMILNLILADLGLLMDDTQLLWFDFVIGLITTVLSVVYTVDLIRYTVESFVIDRQRMQ